MAEYHVGCGAFGIYAGTLNKNNTMWKNRSDCTEEALSAVAEYLLKNDVSIGFEYNGKPYIIQVIENE